MIPTIVLIGPPGAGKTSVAGAIAELLKLPVIDTDVEIEAVHGPIPKIFVEHGESGFREFERQAVANALAGPAAIVSLGGGALTHPLTRNEVATAQQAGASVVELQVAAQTAVARIGASTTRPLLSDLSVSKWQELVADRLPVYAQAASISIDTSALTPGQVATEILTMLGITTTN